MSRLRLSWIIPLILAAAVGGLSALAAPSGDLVVVENGSIRISVNNTADGLGRFAVDVTGGDSQRPEDDGQPLIYGRPIPWTTFTTIQLDGLPFAFGGPTSRRAGKGLAIGEMVSPPQVHNGTISTTWRYGNMEVLQHLSIVEGPTTGLPDTVRIAYILSNRGDASHRVGLRVCLDTMLGANDGAPFRVGEQQVLTDDVLTGVEIQPYWQAFDSLEGPRVIAQGTLAGGELTPPDELFFTNWGTLADVPWRPVLVKGRDFTRLGEFEPDSAVGLLWDEKEIPPGGVVTRVTYYGLGGVTIAAGELTLGLTAPSTAGVGESNRFLVLGYLENLGEGAARDVSMKLDLPESLRAVSPPVVQLGQLKPKESKQVAWMVEGTRPGTANIKVTAEGFELDGISVQRSIRLTAPPRVTVTVLETPMVKTVPGSYDPYPVPVQAIVSNVGGDTCTQTWVELAPGAGSALSPGEGKHRYVGSLAPGEEVLLRWNVAMSGSSGPSALSVIAGSRECEAVVGKGSITWPAIPAQVRVVQSRVEGRSDWRRVDILLAGLPDAARLTLRLDLPDGVRLMAVQRGGFALADGKVLPWLIEPAQRGTAVSMGQSRPVPLGRITDSYATVWLSVPEDSVPEIGGEIVELLDAQGRPIPAIIIHE